MSGNLVRPFHASVNSPYKTVFNYDLNFTKKYELFKLNDSIADVVVYGHMHYQFMEKIYGKTLVNCGGVGTSGCPVLEDGYDSKSEISNAHYLIICGNLNVKENGKLEFIFGSVPYDKKNRIKRITRST